LIDVRADGEEAASRRSDDFAVPRDRHANLERVGVLVRVANRDGAVGPHARQRIEVLEPTASSRVWTTLRKGTVPFPKVKRRRTREDMA
jgi:hypothetical protein